MDKRKRKEKLKAKRVAEQRRVQAGSINSQAYDPAIEYILRSVCQGPQWEPILPRLSRHMHACGIKQVHKVHEYYFKNLQRRTFAKTREECIKYLLRGASMLRTIAGPDSIVVGGIAPIVCSPYRNVQSILDDFMWLMSWGRDWFPSIRLKEEQIADLVFTDRGDAELNELKPPWDFFAIELPTNLFQFNTDLEHPSGYTWSGKASAHIVMVSYYNFGEIAPHYENIEGKTSRQNKWQVQILCIRETGSTEKWSLGSFDLWSGVRSSSSLFSEIEDSPDTSENYLPASPEDKRVISSICRLVLNLCCSIHYKVATINRASEGPVIRNHDGKPIQRKEYVLGLPVKINHAHVLRDYLKGTGTMRKVRWLTRGHWRNQAYGPRHSLRHKIWIQPHWNGKIDAPVNVRHHEFEDS